MLARSYHAAAVRRPLNDDHAGAAPGTRTAVVVLLADGSIHELMWNATKVAGEAKKTNDVAKGQELIDLITTQRAFELNSQTVQAGDQILELVANLGRL